MLNLYLIIWILVFLPLPAYAYLDPGLGSLILQSIIGGFAVIFSFISLFWFKIKSYILKLSKNFKSKYIKKK